MSFWVHCDEISCKEASRWDEEQIPLGWFEVNCRERDSDRDNALRALSQFVPGIADAIEQVESKTSHKLVTRHFCPRHQMPAVASSVASTSSSEESGFVDPEVQELIKKLRGEVT